MVLKLSLKCKACGFELNAEESDGPIPEACPSCGGRDLEFSVRLEAEKQKTVSSEEIDRPYTLHLEEAFVKQTSPGEYLVDLSLASRDIMIAELEPGVYDILISTPSRSSSRLL